MHVKKKLLIGLLYLVAQNTWATEWSSIIEKDTYQILVDIDSYRVEGSLPLMTIKTHYKTAQAYQSAEHSVTYTTSIKEMQFNCKKPYYRVTSTQLFNASQQLIVTKNTSLSFKSIEFDTDEFSIGQLTCQVHQMLGA